MTYIRDLMRRMRSDEKLPQSGKVRSSADTVSFQAHREAERIQDIELFGEIEEVAGELKDDDQLRDLAFIISYLVKNTGLKAANDLLYKIFIDYKKDDDDTLAYLIDAARRARNESLQGEIRKIIKNGGESSLPSGIEYLGEVVGEPALQEIAHILENDVSEDLDPIYCISALESIGSPKCIPYLQRAIEINIKGTKEWQKQCVYFCNKAIGRIKEKNGL